MWRSILLDNGCKHASQSHVMNNMVFVFPVIKQEDVHNHHELTLGCDLAADKIAQGPRCRSIEQHVFWLGLLAGLWRGFDESIFSQKVEPIINLSI